MRVLVNLTVGEKEVILEGDCPLFGNKINYTKGYDRSLRDIGMWLDDWRYSGNSGPAHNGRVFIPWTSALYIIEQK